MVSNIDQLRVLEAERLSYETVPYMCFRFVNSFNPPIFFAIEDSNMPILITPIFDTHIISQSFMSITITLITMFFTGLLFKNVMENSKITHFPFVLITSSVLGFKTNVELGYVIHMTLLKNTIPPIGFKKAVVSNSCLIMFESFGIALFSVLLAIPNVLAESHISIFYEKIVLPTILACLASSLLFIISFALSHAIAFYFSIDPENILLPILNAINDILVVQLLAFFVFNAVEMDHIKHFALAFLIGLFMLLCFLMMYKSENLLPFQRTETILLTFALNTISSFILERSTAKYPMITPAFPVFGGMATSIAFILLHKSISTLESQSSGIPNVIHYSLILIAFFISLIYIFMSYMLEISFSFGFSVSFIFTFTLHVILLLKIVDYSIKFVKKNNISISSNLTPIISAISDFLGTMFLLFICTIILKK